jgi:shikimate kinase
MPASRSGCAPIWTCCGSACATRPPGRCCAPPTRARPCADLYEARLPFYSQADLAVDASPDYSVEEMAARVVEALKTRPDVLEEA